MTVKCKHCKNFENGTCTAKTHGGGICASVSGNKNRQCDKFKPDPKAYAKEADKIYEKGKIPVYSPTWRYYATDRELRELGEEKGPLFVRINPNV